MLLIKYTFSVEQDDSLDEAVSRRIGDDLVDDLMTDLTEEFEDRVRDIGLSFGTNLTATVDGL